MSVLNTNRFNTDAVQYALVQRSLGVHLLSTARRRERDLVGFEGTLYSLIVL
jgi:hypothetical protein